MLYNQSWLVSMCEYNLNRSKSKYGSNRFNYVLLGPHTYQCNTYWIQGSSSSSSSSFFSHYDSSFCSLNITQSSPNLEYMSHLAKIAILQFHPVWVCPGDCIAVDGIFQTSHTWMKFGMHMYHDQMNKTHLWTHNLSPTGSWPFWFSLPFWPFPCLLL